MLFLQCTVVTCIPYSYFWTYLVKEGGAVHGRLFGDWWWAAAKGFGDHSIIVGHSHSTLVHFHLLFQQSTFREKENGFKEVAQRQWNLPASVLPAYKSKNTFSKNTSSNWTGQDQMLRTMNFGYVALEVKKNQLQRHLLMAWSRFILLLFKASSAGSLCQKQQLMLRDKLIVLKRLQRKLTKHIIVLDLVFTQWHK